MNTARLVDLFDAERVGPNVGAMPRVGGAGGGLEETQARGRNVGYYPGGAATAAEFAQMMESAGPEGPLLAGGGRRRGRSRRRRQQRRRRRQTTRQTRRRR